MQVPSSVHFDTSKKYFLNPPYCRAGVGKLWQFARQPENIELEKMQLISDVCIYLPEEDQLGCYNGVYQWWQAITEHLFTPESAARVCNAISSDCNLPTLPNPKYESLQYNFKSLKARGA